MGRTGLNIRLNSLYMINVDDKKIGILGGTFNPVHSGHLLLAQNAMERLELSKVLFIPCANPPHKAATTLASAEHRLAMLELATEHDLHFEVSDMEIRRGGYSYTIDTIRELKRINPSAELYFIIGTDSLLELHTWKNIHDLLKLCRFITFSRPGTEMSSIDKDTIRLDPPWPDRLIKDVMTGQLLDISSSDIRYRVAEGMSIRYLVPQGVEMYIAEHNLYTKQ